MPAIKNVKEYLETNKDAFVVLLFDAEFSGQQAIVKRSIEALNESVELKDKIAFGTVDVEENDEFAHEFAILSVPMVVCLLNGQLVRKIDTLEPSKLVNIIQEELKRHTLLSATSSTSGRADLDPKEKLNIYLKQLVNRAPVMIFMKGDPKAPRCGFSRQLVELLSKHDIKYESFDILQHDEVRQGLKEYSDWPTYPQIYAKGEFVGGLDILKNLEETGELEATLKLV